MSIERLNFGKKPSIEKEFIPEQEKILRSKLEEFGLNIENLKEIEGFNNLSYGQKLLVLENLKQLTLGRIQEEALEKYKTKTTEAKFLGRVWLAVSKKYQIAKLEKTTASEIVKGGMEAHKRVLQQLVNGIKEIGLEVEERNGKLEIQYAVFENLSPEEKKIVDNFNKIANEFSRMPYEWGLKTATKEEQARYYELKKQYEEANAQILKLRLKKNNNDLQEASLYINDIRGKVELNQFFTAHPEVEEQLQKIREKKTWLKALSNVVTERGIYATAGFITRSITTSLIGLAGIPLAAAGMGGWMARKRAKETLIEREKMARRGVKDISKEARNFVEAENLIKKIDTLIQKIESEENLERKKQLCESLSTRVFYTQDKIEKGLVIFGTEEERLKNQIEIIQKLSKARVYVVNYLGIEGRAPTELEKRLEKFLEFREKKISKTQREYIIRETAKGAFLGAGFALAGYALRHFASEWFNWKKPPEIISKASAAEIKKEIGMPTPIPKDNLEYLPIGKRGPEGAIIDYFKQNPEVAKNFGWNPQKHPSLEEWAGKKAHLLWLEEAKEALKKPETLETLKKLGYSPDLKGYEEMMTRIGKGYVEIDPNTGKIELREMEYLRKLKPKVRIEEVGRGPQVFEETPEGPQIFEEVPQKPQIFEEPSLSPKNFDSNLYNFATALDEKWDLIKNLKLKSISGPMAKEVLGKLGDPQIYIENKTEISLRNDDVIVIKNAYKEGFDLLVNFDKEKFAQGIISGKIGVDGPGGWDKFVRGTVLGIGRTSPDAPLTFDNLQEAKTYILEYEKESMKALEEGIKRTVGGLETEHPPEVSTEHPPEIPKGPQVFEEKLEGPQVFEEKPKGPSVEEIKPSLDTESIKYFDNLSQEKIPLGAKIDKIIEDIKTGKISIDSFERYYLSKVGAKTFSPELKHNLEMNFKILLGERTPEVEEFIKEHPVYQGPPKKAEFAARRVIEILFLRATRK